MHNKHISDMNIEELAVYIANYLKQKDIDIVLVGGACVSIYSNQAYISGDIDLISYQSGKMIKQALNRIGFEFTRSKYFIHPDTTFIIEFVNPPISVGNEPVHDYHVHKIYLGEIKLLTPTDCVKDRLSAYYHWDDEQSLSQALLVCNNQEVDMNQIREWSARENMMDKYRVFEKMYSG